MLRQVSFKGAPLNLVGRNLQENSAAPNFKVVSPDLKEVSLLDFGDKIKLITSFPSSDTPVCDLQLKEFNKRASQMSDEIIILGISKDLPFALGRFCQTNSIESVKTFSDYKFSSFGINYGLLIKELNLLARAVFIIDKTNIIRYIQVVPEITNQLDYEDVFAKLDQVLKNPSQIPEGLPAKCMPCEVGGPSLSKEKIDASIAQHQGWELIDDKKIRKEFKFKDFIETKYFCDLVAIIAQEQGHHPSLTLTYNKLKITLTTHAVGGLSDNDFIMAGIIDQMGG